jgi:hypothetical protein
MSTLPKAKETDPREKFKVGRQPIDNSFRALAAVT